MSVFIKTGFWKKFLDTKAPEGWFNLGKYIQDLISENPVNTGNWIDYTNSSNIVGWGSYTKKLIKYKVTGNTLFVYFSIEGISDNIDTSFTLPFNMPISITANIIYAVNDDTDTIAFPIISGNNISFFRFTKLLAGLVSAPILSSWTESNTKKINGQFFLELN